MRNQRTTKSPILVKLLLTRKCNLDCSYCSAVQYHELENGPELSTTEWIRLIRRLKEIQVFTVELSGGEIFKRNDIQQILEVVSEHRFPKIVINSNGTLIGHSIAKGLREMGFKYLSISLDGDEAAHDMLRGRGSFKKTLAGIKHLLSVGITPKVLFTLLKSNHRCLEAMADVLYPLGIRDLSFNALHPGGNCKDIFKDIVLDRFTEAEEFMAQFESLRLKYPDFNFGQPPLVYHCYPQRFRAGMPELKNKSAGGRLKLCTAGHSTCCITSSGWMLPCTELFDFRGGNIRENDIVDIWQGAEKFETIRRLSNVTTDQIQYCSDCNYKVFCSAGCRADAYAVYGDIMAPDPYCPYWKPT